MEDEGMTSLGNTGSDFISELYLNYASRLRRKAYGILKDYQRAEDAVQMTFTAIYKNLDKLEQDIRSKRTLSYLYTTLENKSYNILRDNKKYLFAVDDNDEDDGFLGVESDDNIFSNVAYAELVEEIGKLPPQYSQIMIMYYVHEYTYKEISEMLEINEPLVRQRMHRAKERLKISLRKHWL